MIVVYYGVNLSLVPCRPSISLHAFLSASIHSPLPFPSYSSLTVPQSRPLHCFSRSLYALVPLPLPLPLPSAPIFTPIRCLPLSFCLLNCPYPAFFPSSSSFVLSISPGLAPPVFISISISILLRFPHPVRILFRSLNLAPPSPSPRGYTSLLQMFRPSQI